MKSLSCKLKAFAVNSPCCNNKGTGGKVDFRSNTAKYWRTDLWPLTPGPHGNLTSSKQGCFCNLGFHSSGWPKRTRVNLFALLDINEQIDSIQKWWPLTLCSQGGQVMLMDQDTQWLYQLLSDVQLEKFYMRVRDGLNITRIEHFAYVKESDLEQIGISKPGESHRHPHLVQTHGGLFHCLSLVLCLWQARDRIDVCTSAVTAAALSFRIFDSPAWWDQLHINTSQHLTIRPIVIQSKLTVTNQGSTNRLCFLFKQKSNTDVLYTCIKLM